jgi:hypothetical protein
MAPGAPREQEQSIKARKREIFEEEQRDTGPPRKPFSAYIASTPPVPLSTGQKAALGAVGALVVLLLLAALLTMPGPRIPRRGGGGGGAAAPPAGGR